MDTSSVRRRRERKKTWSSFGELGRKPNDYEIVTHNMNHTRGDTPLEMGPEVHGNVWLKKYRDGTSLQVAEWDGFRDPDRLTYDAYVKMQDQEESFIDALLETCTAQWNIDEALSAGCLDLLGLVYTPQRFLAHGLQMLSGYLQQLAPSSYVANCAAFQAADQLRRVQRVAYRTKQLDSTHPAKGFGSRERAVWEEDPRWQPIRKAIEQLLVVYAWDEAFVAANLVIRPILDELFLGRLAKAARASGDELDALLLENLAKDGRRHNRWSAALSRYIVSQDPANRVKLRGLSAMWTVVGDEVIAAGARLLAEHCSATPAREIEAEVRARVIALRADAELAQST
jgi:hypothetical protein